MNKNIWNIIAVFIGIFGICFVACDDNKSSEANTQSNIIATTQSLESNIETNVEESTYDVSSEINTNVQGLYKKCIACHGAKGNKIAPGSVDNVLISNLSKDEIIKNLLGYRARTLSKGGTAAVMYLLTKDLSNSDIEVLGEYISSFQ